MRRIRREEKIREREEKRKRRERERETQVVWCVQACTGVCVCVPTHL